MEYLPPVSSTVKSWVLRLLNYVAFVTGQRGVNWIERKYQWGSDEEYCRVQYFIFLGTAMIQLQKRYEQPEIKTYIKLENVIVKPVTSYSKVDQYPQLDGSTLYTQLAVVK